MAEEDLTRTGRNASGRSAGHRAATTPARHRSSAAFPYRRLLERWLPTGQRRALTALALLAGLVAVIAYVGNRPGPVPAPPGGVPAGVGGPTRFPAVEANRTDTGPASPGLRPRQRPPSVAPTPAAPKPAPPLLTVTQREIPAEVDLSAAGTRDWVHWGLRGGGSTVRKRDGSGEIVDEGGSGARGGWDGNQEVFSWHDGSPERAVDGTPNGVYTCGAGSGFALAVAGSGELRTVRLYAGLWMARGRLEAKLSTGGPTTTLRMEDPHTSRSAEFTLRFRAPKGARLLITWTVETVFTGDCGNVGLQAVALR